jgi:hypothetical protein
LAPDALGPARRKEIRAIAKLDPFFVRTRKAQLVRVFDNYTDRVRDLALLSDELRVVLAIERSLQVWNLESSQSARRSVEHGSAVTAVVITPAGRRAWILKGPQNRQTQGSKCGKP